MKSVHFLSAMYVSPLFVTMVGQEHRKGKVYFRLMISEVQSMIKQLHHSGPEMRQREHHGRAWQRKLLTSW